MDRLNGLIEKNVDVIEVQQLLVLQLLSLAGSLNDALLKLFLLLDEIAESILQILFSLEGRKDLTSVLHIVPDQTPPLFGLVLESNLCLLHHFPIIVSFCFDLGVDIPFSLYLELLFLSVHLPYDIHEVQVLGLD